MRNNTTMKKIRKGLKIVDLFGSNISLNFKEKDKYQTAFGGSICA